MEYWNTGYVIVGEAQYSNIPIFESFFLVSAIKIRILDPMPRGKRTVFAFFCKKSGNRLGTLRFHRQDKKAKGWKEHVDGMKKYCPVCREKVDLKFKEEKHSSK